MRPNVAFSPKVPVKPAGIRMEPAAVAAGADGEDAAGHRRRRASGRPAGGALEVVGVRRRAVQARVGAVDAAELGGRGLPDEHRTGLPQPRRHRPVVGRDAVLEDERRLGQGPALHGVELLDAHRAHRRRAATRRPMPRPPAPAPRRRSRPRSAPTIRSRPAIPRAPRSGRSSPPGTRRPASRRLPTMVLPSWMGNLPGSRTSRPGRPAARRGVGARPPVYSVVRCLKKCAASGPATARISTDQISAASTGCCIGQA